VHEVAIKSNLKDFDLELGGKLATLIFDDCDMENALLHSSQSFLGNSGQVCVAGYRALAQEGIAPHFIESLKARFQKSSSAMGDGMNPATYLRHVADKAQFTRVMNFIEGVKKNGAPLRRSQRRHWQFY
jgi:aldehyde dehydrogenase (NAD+)